MDPPTEYANLKTKLAELKAEVERKEREVEVETCTLLSELQEKKDEVAKITRLLVESQMRRSLYLRLLVGSWIVVGLYLLMM